MPTDLSTPPAAGGGGRRSPAEVKARAIASLNRLADRDTFAMAAAELEAMAAGLPPDSIAAFLACIHDTDASHRSPVRRQCVRLLSTLARAHRDALAPLLPRLLAAVLRRLRDPDSAVRAACVDAVAAAAASVALPPFAASFLKPLSDAILANHDAHLQAGAALCLAAAVDSAPAIDAAAASQMQRGLLPRFLKLLRSDGFKAKPALVAAIGSMVNAGGARSESLLKALVPCLVELLSNEDWAVRKAATEALIKVATVERRLVGEYKERCLSAFEARRFDKVKVVRDLMNQMIDAWKQVSEASFVDENSLVDDSRSPPKDDAAGPRASGTTKSDTTLNGRRKFSPSKSSPALQNTVSPTSTHGKNSSNEASVPLSVGKLVHKHPSDSSAEITSPGDSPIPTVVKKSDQNDNGKDGRNSETKCFNNQSKLEVKRALFGKNRDVKIGKFSVPRFQSRVVPLPDIDSMESSVNGPVVEEFNEILHGDSDLSVIRNQLVNIESQQSSLLDLLQKFIGNSQKGIRSLETRVQGLEMAIDEMSYDMAVSSSRIRDADTAENTCCRLPGTEFLSSKFWRRMDGGRYSNSRLSAPEMSPCFGCYRLEKGKTKPHRELLLNPLTDVPSYARSDTSSCAMSVASMNPTVAESQIVYHCSSQDITLAI